jgi:hypothetical protein
MNISLKSALLASGLILTANAQASVIAENLSTARSGGNDAVSFNFNDLSSHSAVTINFDLTTLDSWDGSHSYYGVDLFGLNIDGVNIFEHSFTHEFGFSQTNTVAPTTMSNFGGAGSQDAFYDNYSGGFTVAHSASTLNVEFYSSGLQSMGDESWYVDDVDISNDSYISAVPAPSVLALMGFGIVGMGFAERRKFHTAKK